MSSRAMPSSLAAAKHASARKRASESSPAGAPSTGLTAFSLNHCSTKLAARLLMERPLVGHTQFVKACRPAPVPCEPDIFAPAVQAPPGMAWTPNSSPGPCDYPTIRNASDQLAIVEGDVAPRSAEQELNERAGVP